MYFTSFCSFVSPPPQNKKTAQAQLTSSSTWWTDGRKYYFLFSLSLFLTPECAQSSKVNTSSGVSLSYGKFDFKKSHAKKSFLVRDTKGVSKSAIKTTHIGFSTIILSKCFHLSFSMDVHHEIIIFRMHDGHVTRKGENFWITYPQPFFFFCWKSIKKCVCLRAW